MAIVVQAYLGHLVTSTLANYPFTPEELLQSHARLVYQRPLVEVKQAGRRLSRGAPRKADRFEPVKCRSP